MYLFSLYASSSIKYLKIGPHAVGNSFVTTKTFLN